MLDTTIMVNIYPYEIITRVLNGQLRRNWIS